MNKIIKKFSIIVLVLFSLVLCLSCKKEETKEKTKTIEPIVNPTPTETETKEPTKIETSGVSTEDDGRTYGPYELNIPDSSTTFDLDFASILLELCIGNEKIPSRKLLEAAGFTPKLQKHFEKNFLDSSHTCAYSVGVKEDTVNGELRNVIIITVRGTMDAEWISNFNFAPSRNDDTIWAENFYACAVDVLNGTKSLIDSYDNPLIIACGHSRGAACSNLLGVLLDDLYGVENVYCYTFATPRTIRNQELNNPNIFNIINTTDVVTQLPMAGLGYKRAGIDYEMAAMPEVEEKMDQVLNVFNALSPTISSYYNDYHALDKSGLSNTGYSTYQLIVYLFSMIETIMYDGIDGIITNFNQECDFYPLFMIVGEFSSGDGFDIIASQHMPSTYQKIIKALKN